MLLNARGFFLFGPGVLSVGFLRCEIVWYTRHLILVLLVAQDFMYVIGMWFCLSGRSENGSSHRSARLTARSPFFFFPFFSFLF